MGMRTQNSFISLTFDVMCSKIEYILIESVLNKISSLFEGGY